MREASGRRATSSARALAFSIILLFQAGLAFAQAPVARAGAWSTDDGGVVNVTESGSYELVITDAETGASIYSSGRVADSRTEADGRVIVTLKPRVQTGGKNESFVMELGPEGNGDLFVLTSTGRHRAATLKK
jgi:hypothetical protein